MKKVIDTQTTDDPNLFGEILREYAFEKEFGCYTCFDLLEEFKPVNPNTELAGKLFQVLSIDLLSQETAEERESDEAYKDSVRDEFINLRKRSQLFSNGNIHLAWYWDGDGTLAFIEEGRAAINTDCKKDHCWKWT